MTFSLLSFTTENKTKIYEEHHFCLELPSHLWQILHFSYTCIITQVKNQLPVNPLFLPQYIPHLIL